MANRTFAGDLKTPEKGLIEYDFRIAMLSGTGGVDAANSRLPTSFLTVARTGVGIITLTLADGFTDLVSWGVTLGNNGTYLPAFTAQPATHPPYALTTSPNSTLLIHVGNATVLADPGATYSLHVNLILKNSAA